MVALPKRPQMNTAFTDQKLFFISVSICVHLWLFFRGRSSETRSLHTSVGDPPMSSNQQRVHQRCRTLRSSSEKSADIGKRLTISRSSSLSSLHGRSSPP